MQAFDGQWNKTNVTLCFSSNQALLAAKAGATYISPFIGRLDDIGHDGMALIQEIRSVYDNYGYMTEILAASIRHPTHVRDASLMGADVATMPFKVIQSLYSHPLTTNGLGKVSCRPSKRKPIEKSDYDKQLLFNKRVVVYLAI